MSYSRSIAIHQPNFFPWLGYFVKIIKSDVFIFLDDVQFPRGNRGCYVNRTSLILNEHPRWLTAPILRQSNYDNIFDVKMHSSALTEIKNKIKSWYRNHPHYYLLEKILPHTLESEGRSIASFNKEVIFNICNLLSISHTFMNSSDMNSTGVKEEKIISLVKLASGDQYISGTGAESYQNEANFTNDNIKLTYLSVNLGKLANYDSYNTQSLSVIHYLFTFGVQETRKLLDLLGED